jgi:uncharacterized protein (TIGR02300 family)
MAKPEWGTKRTGPCGTKIYDFNKRPIICPSCGGKVNTSEVLVKPLKKEKSNLEISSKKNDVKNNDDDISRLDFSFFRGFTSTSLVFTFPPQLGHIIGLLLKS